MKRILVDKERLAKIKVGDTIYIKPEFRDPILGCEMALVTQVYSNSLQIRVGEQEQVYYIYKDEPTNAPLYRDPKGETQGEYFFDFLDFYEFYGIWYRRIRGRA